MRDYLTPAHCRKSMRAWSQWQCYYTSRAAKHVEEALGPAPPAGAVLQTDGYAAYAQYAKRMGLTHAQCWAHSRRKVFEAQDIEPGPAGQALEAIRALYAVEAEIREQEIDQS